MPSHGCSFLGSLSLDDNLDIIKDVCEKKVHMRQTNGGCKKTNGIDVVVILYVRNDSIERVSGSY